MCHAEFSTQYQGYWEDSVSIPGIKATIQYLHSAANAELQLALQEFLADQNN